MKLTSNFRASQVAVVVKNPPANAGDTRDMSSISGSGRSLGEGNGYLLWYSCLENSMDRGAWQDTVFRVAKSQTQLSDFVCMQSAILASVVWFFFSNDCL